MGRNNDQLVDLNSETATIYVHFPYCDFKCAYCDFYSVVKKDDRHFYENYLFHLKQDLLKKKAYISRRVQIGSIFLGGGTPSKVPVKYIRELLFFLYKNFSIQKNAEITLEANPESLTTAKAEGYLKAGVNRIHVGIQTHIPRLLKYLGREYKEDACQSVFSKIKKAGLENYGGDILYGIPSQRIREIKGDIDWMLDQGCLHISAYCLTIEQDTLLEKQIKQKAKPSPSIRRQSLHYDFIMEYLRGKNFNRYEISNFSRKKYHSRHNMQYWKYRPYLGVGVSSHSFLPPFRLLSPRDINSYLQGNYFTVEKAKKFPELFIGIFRLTFFQNFSFFRRQLDHTELLKFQALLYGFERKGWLKLFPSGFRITPEGSKFSDSMLEEAALGFS